MDYDTIIIGSGLGGLTTAATLSKKGKKVLVIEQHFIPGGCATTFTRKGVTFEVGLHEMDMGTYKQDMKGLIFKKLGLDKTLPLIKLPELWRIKTNTQEYTVPEGRKNAKEYLKKMFPHEKRGIDRYFFDMWLTTYINHRFAHDMNPIQFLFSPIINLPIFIRNRIQNASTGEKLDKYIKDPALKNILDINLAYYADDPYKFSWFYHSAAQYSYYNSGTFIKGGSQVLSNQLVDVLTQHGGEIIYNSEVKQLLLDGKKVIGVSYYDKRKKENISVYSKNVVANCAPENIFGGNMVPKEIREPKVDNLEPSSSLYTVYIIFKKKLSQLYKNMAYSTFIGDDDLLHKPLADVSEVFKKVPVEERPFVLVDYSTIDSGLVPDGDERGFGVLCSISNLAEWESLGKEDYKAKKELLAKRLLERLEEHYPGITEQVEYFEVSTPKTIKRYIMTPAGTAYGYYQKGFAPKTRAPRRASQLKNLYFTGAWGFPGGGFTGAILSGYYCALDMMFPSVAYVAIGTVIATLSCTALSKIIHYVIEYLKNGIF